MYIRVRASIHLLGDASQRGVLELLLAVPLERSLPLRRLEQPVHLRPHVCMPMPMRVFMCMYMCMYVCMCV